MGLVASNGAGSLRKQIAIPVNLLAVYGYFKTGGPKKILGFNDCSKHWGRILKAALNVLDRQFVYYS